MGSCQWLYLATVIDLFSRKLLDCPTSEHANAELACDAIKIAAAVRGRGKIDGGDLPYRPRLDLYREKFRPAM
jgi:transposase InsO family protein